MKYYTITFQDSDKPDLILPEGAILSEHLDAVNSPILFGCRSGICGTCLCEMEAENNIPDADEIEVLALYAPGNPQARLACQLILRSNITLKKLNSDE